MSLPPELVEAIVARCSLHGVRVLEKFLKAGSDFVKAVNSRVVLSNVRLDREPDWTSFVHSSSKYHSFFVKCLNQSNPCAVYAQSLRLIFVCGESSRAKVMLGPIKHLYPFARLMYVMLEVCDSAKSMMNFLDYANHKMYPLLNVRKLVVEHIRHVLPLKVHTKKRVGRPRQALEREKKTASTLGVRMSSRIKGMKGFEEQPSNGGM